MNEGENGELDRQENSIDKTQKVIDQLPPELRTVVTNFFLDVAKSIQAQQTGVGETDEVITQITPDQQSFYKRRFAEVIEKGVFNPHSPDSDRRITFSESVGDAKTIRYWHGHWQETISKEDYDRMLAKGEPVSEIGEFTDEEWNDWIDQHVDE